MDAKSLAIKTQVADQRMVAAAQAIADHFKFSDEMAAVLSNANASRQPGIAHASRLEGIASLLELVVSNLESAAKAKPESADKRK